MTDKELIRRALLGDQEAQQECTDKGIAIPCPFCQGDKTARRYVCGEGFVECLTCHAISSMRSNPDVSLKDWNTRPALPVIHAKWEWHGPCRDNKGTYWATCTACGIRQRLGDYENYCPKCGARMDLEGDEQ